MAKILTIRDLYKVLATEIKLGNGNKKIMLSADDEGNAFHPMFFDVTKITEDFAHTNFCGISFEDAINNYVILG